jgi:hypothetical protein
VYNLWALISEIEFKSADESESDPCGYQLQAPWGWPIDLPQSLFILQKCSALPHTVLHIYPTLILTAMKFKRAVICSVGKKTDSRGVSGPHGMLPALHGL